jgi:hypothetical protein
MKDVQARAGRQRRPVERDYLAALSDAVPLETWREICREAAERAKAGDAKARDWLARHLLGEKPILLVHLAADERVGFTAEDEIEQQGKAREQARILADLCLPSLGGASRG